MTQAQATGMPARDGATGSSREGVEGWLIAAGALGVLATTAFYVMSPPAAVMPGIQPFSAEEARIGAIAGAETMRLAGLFGVPGDLLWASGAVIVGQRVRHAGRPLAAAGWILMALALLLFAIVDTLVGFVLPQLARVADGLPTFTGAKILFDAMFLWSAASFAAGALLAALGDWKGVALPRAPLLSWLSVLTAIAALAGAIGSAMGEPWQQLLGASIAGFCVIYLVDGIRLARS